VKILIPTADYPPIEGGISTLTLNIARELSAMGHEVTVVAPRFAGMAEFDRAEPYRVVRFRGYGLGWLRFVPMAFASMRRARPAELIVGVNIAYGGVIGLIARRLWRIPYVTFAYAFEFLKFPGDTLPAGLLRRAYDRSTAVFAISRFTRDALVRFGVAPERVQVAYPGASPARAISSAEVAGLYERLALNGHRMIFAAGRMMPRKGHATLIRALPEILERHPDTILVWAGRGPARGEVDRAIHDLRLKDHVRLPGRLSDEDLSTLYSMCDVFALPAGEGARGQVEGFGLVFAEAGAYGKPVVAGNTGGVAEAVLDGETGLLVPPDDPAAAANAILRLLDDPALASCLGANGRDRVARELNWPAFTRRILDALELRS
jgi:phosphatidylinositol alpha-1,6-mannosyltransferase